MIRNFLLSALLGILVTCTLSVSAREPVVSSEPYRLEENIPYRSDSERAADPLMEERCRLDVHVPTGAEGFATVVWFHGGGLSGGEKFIPEELKEQGIAVVAANYRLAPAVSAPAYIEDAAAAVAWTIKNIESYGGDPRLVFVSGHSAGGYLASMIGLDKQWLAVHGIDANELAGLIPFSGHTITHFSIRAERGIPEYQAVVDEYAPLTFVRADAPPLVLITGDRELELLGRYEENAYMARMMKLAGHTRTTLYELDGFDHGQMARPAFDILLRKMREISAERKKGPASGN
jgi:acetyl esterase/lipase